MELCTDLYWAFNDFLVLNLHMTIFGYNTCTMYICKVVHDIISFTLVASKIDSIDNTDVYN